MPGFTLPRNWWLGWTQQRNETIPQHSRDAGAMCQSPAFGEAGTALARGERSMSKNS
jgi:hypothetical protein